MDPEKLKVVDLRMELSKRGLDTKGVKSVLVERLRKAIDEENANQEVQKKANTNAENDSTSQEDDERSTKSTKIPQTPKKSSRLSKAAPIMTPREDTTKKRRTTRTPYSRKQTSPKKSDQNDMSREPSPAISESALPEETTMQEETTVQEEATLQEEATVQEETTVQKETRVQEETIVTKENVMQEEKPILPEKNEQMQEEKSELSESNEQTETKESLSDIKQEGTSTTEVLKEDIKDINVKESNENESKVNTSQVSVVKSPVKIPIKSPVKSINITEPVVTESKDNADDTDQNQKLVETTKRKQEILESSDIEDENVASNIQENDTLNVINNKCDKMDDVKMEPVVNEEKEDINPLDNVQTVESVCDTKTDIPKIDEPSDDMIEEEKDTDMTESNTMEVEEQSIEDKDISVGSEKEVDDTNVDAKEDKDVEIIEIKHKEDTDVVTKARRTKTPVVHRDRKRKRSPSPLEVRHDSPPPVIIDNEPEIDDAALILSWYDSDLNLVINKDGFFTATPMHNDGFSHMWAGARASYGFLCGKVYYEAKIVEHCPVNTENEEHPYVLRIGWSVPYTSMQLGEEKFSFGYCSTGKKLTDNRYDDYGVQFGKDDVIGCYFDATSENNIILSYTVNGKDQGVAFSISKEELGDKPLFPHILSKNCSFACNFGQETPWTEEILPGYVSIGNVEPQYKIPGPRRPEKKEECEVIMMCGLPACGKTTWATKYASENPQKMYNVLGLGNLIDKMKDPELSNKEDYDTQWKILIQKCTYALDKLLEMASSRRRNYILDQTNVYPSAQRRKMKNFCGYQRKAVVLVPSEEEFKLRTAKHVPIEGKEITESMLLEMKANFIAPVVGDSFDDVDWIELDQEEGTKLIEKYNKEGKEAGYGQQQPIKIPRIDSRSDSAREHRNDSRSNRDYRDRRNNYVERNRNPVWRGGGNMLRRDRPQRGPIRHGGGYGPPVPRRGRGTPIPSVHRGTMDRRGGNLDRRTGNDRGRSLNSRQSGWVPMWNYQGSQQGSGWNQGNWSSSGQSQGGGWGQQNNWGSQQWGNWRGYGQGSYTQSNYSQGYGNGNCNSWNQQYYSQYWSQQQPSGQTTATSRQTANKQ